LLEAQNTTTNLKISIMSFTRASRGRSPESPPAYQPLLIIQQQTSAIFPPLQIEEFRRLRSHVKGAELLEGNDGMLGDNFRPTQPLSDRTVRAAFQWPWLPTANPEELWHLQTQAQTVTVSQRPRSALFSTRSASADVASAHFNKKSIVLRISSNALIHPVLHQWSIRLHDIIQVNPLWV